MTARCLSQQAQLNPTGIHPNTAATLTDLGLSSSLLLGVFSFSYLLKHKDGAAYFSGLMDIGLSNGHAANQEQITDSNTENFQIQETENDVSLNMNSVSSAEPDVVEVGDIEPKTLGSPAHATDTHSIDTKLSCA
ncbi:hypothetical protein Tco_0961617 [Tanacetum coccineum]